MSGPRSLWTGDDVADQGESAEPGLPSAEPVDEGWNRDNLHAAANPKRTRSGSAGWKRAR